MPWKNAIQDKGAKRSGKTGQKVDGAEEASDESKSDSASKGA